MISIADSVLSAIGGTPVVRLRRIVSTGDANCDQGSTAAGVPEGSSVVGVYFKTKADAEAFKNGVKPKPIGLAQIKITCAD